MKILFATDDSKFSEAAAKSLAEQFRPQDTEVRVLHVVEPITISAPPQMAPGSYPELEDRLPPAHEGRRADCENALFCWFPGDHVSHHRRPEERHFGRCLRWNADLIVLGSHGRTGLGRFLPWRVSEAVARHARCSVQIVRVPS